MSEVASMYGVDYDGYSAWMETGITNEVDFDNLEGVVDENANSSKGEEYNTEGLDILFEVEENRDRTSKHYRLSDGTIMAADYGMDVHYEKDGEWKDIDNRFVYEAPTAADPMEGFSTAEGNVKFKFAPDTGDGEVVRAAAGGEPIMRVEPYINRRVGIVTTGNEIFYGRIKDEFTPVVIQKVEEYGSEVVGVSISNDDSDNVGKCIRAYLDQGCDMVICTGGMSVDPDDRTPLAIRNVCSDAVTYGAPVLPGAMFMLAYYGDAKIPVIGLPGCVMYARRTIFDIVLPRVMTGEILEKSDIDKLGEGGLCLNCKVCTFPNCGFGK